MAQQLRALLAAARHALRHDAPDRRGGHQHALRHERRHHLVRGVGIHLQLLPRHAHGGELVAGAQLPRNDGLFHREQDLLRHGPARLEVDGEGKHSVLFELVQLVRQAFSAGAVMGRRKAGQLGPAFSFCCGGNRGTLWLHNMTTTRPFPVLAWLATAALALSSGARAAAPAPTGAAIPIEHFFADSAMRSVQLSPDGRHLAFRTTLGTGHIGIAMMDLETGKTEALVAMNDENITQYRSEEHTSELQS